MNRLKIAILIVLAVLGLTLIIQNTESVNTRLLFITVSMPRAVLLLLTGMIGFITGLLTALMIMNRRKAKS